MLRQKNYCYGEDLAIPSHLHFGKLMLERCLEYSDHPALINADTDESLTFAELAQQTVDIALSLARIGVRKGQVVSVCSDKRMEVIPTILGVLCAGAVYTLTENPPLVHRLEISRPKVMFMSSSAFELHKSLLDSVECIEKYIIYEEQKDQNHDGRVKQNGHQFTNGGENPDGCENKDGSKRIDVMSFKDFLTETAKVSDFMPTPVEGWKDWAFILFSSGTTGLPKGVPMTHMGILINSHCYVHERYEKSSILLTREWFLSYGLLVALGSLRKGLAGVFSPRNREEDALRAVDKYQIKIIQSAPTAISQLIKSSMLARYDVTSVEALISSSMPVGKEQVEAVKKRLPNLRGVYQIYGTSEAGGACNEMYAPRGARAGAAGTPSHGFIIKVVDVETREPLGPLQRGEICFKSPSLTPGYIGAGPAWGELVDGEGFYKTGDVGYRDQDGYFYVVTRLKDLIKYKDYSVAPAELEAILCENGQVREAGVSMVDGVMAALVVLEADSTATAQQVVDHFHSVAPPRFRLEGGVHFAPHLPRGAGDKLDRRALLLALQRIIATRV